MLEVSALINTNVTLHCDVIYDGDVNFVLWKKVSIIRFYFWTEHFFHRLFLFLVYVYYLYVSVFCLFGWFKQNLFHTLTTEQLGRATSKNTYISTALNLT